MRCIHVDRRRCDVRHASLWCRTVRENLAVMCNANSKMLTKLTAKCSTVDSLLNKLESMGMHINEGLLEGKELREMQFEVLHVLLDNPTASVHHTPRCSHSYPRVNRVLVRHGMCRRFWTTRSASKSATSTRIFRTRSILEPLTKDSWMVTRAGRSSLPSCSSRSSAMR